jgi:hypothetical protein
VPFVNGEAFDGPLFVSVGGQAVTAGGRDTVSENVGHSDDVLAVADHGGPGGVAQHVRDELTTTSSAEASVGGDGLEYVMGTAGGQPTTMLIEEQGRAVVCARQPHLLAQPGLERGAQLGVQWHLAVLAAFAVADDQVPSRAGICASSRSSATVPTTSAGLESSPVSRAICRDLGSVSGSPEYRYELRRPRHIECFTAKRCADG